VKGAPADVAVLDPASEWRVEPERFLSKGRYTPWKGMLLTGRCVCTVVDGAVVFESGGAAR
jgi:dihydroorotase